MEGERKIKELIFLENCLTDFDEKISVINTNESNLENNFKKFSHKKKR